MLRHLSNELADFLTSTVDITGQVKFRHTEWQHALATCSDDSGCNFAPDWQAGNQKKA